MCQSEVVRGRKYELCNLSLSEQSPTSTEQLCPVHMRSERCNKECPACMEGGPQYLLACGHQMHLKCLEHLNNSKCPLCQTALDLPECLTVKIAANNIQCRRDQDEEYFLQLLRASSGVGSDNTEREISTAIIFLRGVGVPEYYIPQDVFVSSRLPIPRGYVFSRLIAETMRGIIDDYVTSDESTSSEDEGTVEEDFPFESLPPHNTRLFRL